MANDYNDKHYKEYWSSLERSLQKKRESAAQPAPSAGEKRSPAPAGRSGKRYRVIRLRYSRIALILVLMIAVIGSVCAIGKRIASGSSAKENTDTGKTVSQSADAAKKDEPAPLSFHFTKDTQELPASNDAQYGIIVDSKSGEVIAARNAKEKAFPASTTKIMTLLTAVENIRDMNDTFTMTLAITDPLYKQEASVAGFLNGEVVSMTDLLYGTILPSGADAAMGLAIQIAGSEQKFVALMNQRVKELGLKNTHFANVTGLFDKNNYTTAYDLAIILKTAMQNELCKTILSTYQYTTAPTSQHPDGILLSSTLFSSMYGTEPETATILGGKTGFVNESGYCIASWGENNETHREYLVVTLKNSARWPAFFGQIDLYKQFAQ